LNEVGIKPDNMKAAPVSSNSEAVEATRLRPGKTKNDDILLLSQGVSDLVPLLLRIKDALFMLLCIRTARGKW
jgi:hypothetical protein